MKRKIIAFACMGVIGLSLSSITASASEVETETSGSFTYVDNQKSPRIKEFVGGGEWNHGTGSKVVNNKSRKTVYSKYNHPTKYHASSCSVGSSSADSGRTKPGSTAASSTEGPAAYQAKANWRYA